MGNVQVPDVQVKVFVAGEEVARFAFDRVDLNPADWEVTAALRDRNAKQAVRACLLACVGELQDDRWVPYSFVPEGDSNQNDQLQLPWE